MTTLQRNDWTTAASILGSCAGGFVPANSLVDAAIRAHQKASALHLDDHTANSLQTAGYALLAVVMAAPRTMSEAGERLEYLSGLPFSAWESTPHISCGPEEYRDWGLRIAASSLQWLGC